MLAIRKRGSAFHVEARLGTQHLRGTLGTRNQDAARRLGHRLETALSEGPKSALWIELRAALPPATFVRFADHAGVTPDQILRWDELERVFTTHLEQRVGLGRMSATTAARYRQTIAEFRLFLRLRQLDLVPAITRPLVEDFKTWRLARIRAQKNSRGGGGLVLDVAVLHRVFAFAIERGILAENPVRLEGRPGENPEHGAQPFTAAELQALRAHVAGDGLLFLLLRWTGLRGSDAVSLLWGEIDLTAAELERVTRKRRKKVIIPLHQELLEALRAEHDRRQPEPGDLVLLNPQTGRALTRPRLYQRMLALGKRAGVASARPHRFRDTLAVDMLLRGGDIYDVAKMLGDTIATVERHYAPFVPQLRQRVRAFLDLPAGLEEPPK